MYVCRTSSIVTFAYLDAAECRPVPQKYVTILAVAFIHFDRWLKGHKLCGIRCVKLHSVSLNAGTRAVYRVVRVWSYCQRLLSHSTRRQYLHYCHEFVVIKSVIWIIKHRCYTTRSTHHRLTDVQHCVPDNGIRRLHVVAREPQRRDTYSKTSMSQLTWYTLI